MNYRNKTAKTVGTSLTLQRATTVSTAPQGAGHPIIILHRWTPPVCTKVQDATSPGHFIITWNNIIVSRALQAAGIITQHRTIVSTALQEWLSGPSNHKETYLKLILQFTRPLALQATQSKINITQLFLRFSSLQTRAKTFATCTQATGSPGR